MCTHCWLAFVKCPATVVRVTVTLVTGLKTATQSLQKEKEASPPLPARPPSPDSDSSECYCRSVSCG